MRIGFFGGSFDPPHLGHLAVARAAATTFSLDRILFVPTAHQPLKPDGATAPYPDRLAMVSLLCELQPPNTPPLFDPSPLEAPLPNTAPNYTVDTLTRLRRTLHSTDSIFAIAGADAFLTLPRWRSSATLLTLADWIVVSRPNFSLQQLDALTLTPQQRQRIHLLDGVQEPASATSIRTLLRAHSDCPGLLPPSILHYIRAHRLYET
jgi:nicotinate-nucleotide adenylyltransferase